MTDALPHPESPRLSKVWAVLWLVFGLWLLYRAVFVGAGSSYVTELNGRVSGATYNDALAGQAVYSFPRTLGVWIAAFLTLSVFSFLYKDNPFYKLAESIFVGVSAAYYMVVGFWTVMVPSLLAKIWPAWIQSWAVPGMSPVRDETWWLYLIPLVLGFMLLWRLSPKGAWIARWPLAFIIGSTAGIRLVGFLQADFLSQIRNTIEPVVVVEAGKFEFWTSVQHLLLVVCVLASLVYFFFSIEHTGAVGKISQVGIWVLMITFGAAFGYTVMGRIALLAIRFEFLFDDWLWLIDPAGNRTGIG
ncbi:hypothetical protein SH661x_001638 [Planctomicrobium sp. SH661]|uniref:hypothetical protein n=1 Tax=Planctomicrobium sp. SH661 TaxID=3448124 RepID=UPI003F5C0FF3